MVAAGRIRYCREHERKRKLLAGGIISGLFFLICVFLAICIEIEFGEQLRNTDKGAGSKAVIIRTADTPWNLVLVNEWNPMTAEYDGELTLLHNGQQVDSRIYPDLQLMFDDARKEGIFPIVREGFRTHEQQTQIFEEKVRAFMKEGHFRKKAEELAGQWVAVPGYSEHELGLAVDINADKERSVNDEVYNWLAENAWRYGFILRYPKGKESITGIDYEPWHYRYVGREAAQEIFEAGITLEEYLK